MASSWGEAWGVSWGNAWGSVSAATPTTTGVPGGATGKPRKPAKRPFLYYPYVQDVPELVTVYPFTFAKPKEAAPVIEPAPLPPSPIFAKPLPFAITSILERHDAPSVEVEKLKVMARRVRARIAVENANNMNIRLLLLLDY